MVQFFFVLQAIIVALLIAVILAQQSSSGLGGLAGGNSQSQFFSGRPEANLLTRLTKILVTLIFLSSLMFAFTQNSFQQRVVQAETTQATEDQPAVIVEE